MKEIQLGNIIRQKRIEKQITQDELAQYLSVSKAAISKWETEQSYPDISLLPLLATYFNISVDELIGYEPQMGKKDIRKLYLKLCRDFQEKNFGEVMEEWEEAVKKYRACLPLLFQMGVVLMNHLNLAPKESQDELKNKALELFQFVEKESDEVYMKQDAQGMAAFCHYMLNQPEEIIDIYGDGIHARLNTEILLSSAYQMKGNIEKAEEVLQISVYQSVIDLVGLIPPLLFYAGEGNIKRDYWIEVFRKIEEVFRLRQMHPTVILPFYLGAAQSYAMSGAIKESLAMLQEYSRIATADIYPLQLHGNQYFDKLEDWFDELGKEAPRADKLVKQSMVEAVEAFHTFFPQGKANEEYEMILGHLKEGLGLKEELSSWKN